MSKIYDYLKDKEDAKVHRNSLRYANQPALQVGGVVWYLSSRNVVSKPLQVTKSWTGMGGRTKVLYRIWPYDTGNPYPPITMHVGQLENSTWRRQQGLCLGLQTDPDEELLIELLSH